MTAMFKAAQPVMAIKSIKESGEFEGLGSTFGGEPDSYGDVIAPGAYANSLAAHKSKGTMPKMFWQHDSSQPIGKWLDASETDEGLMMHGKLNMGVQRGKEAYALLKERDIDGLSIGYRIKASEVDIETGICTLTEIDLQEVSVVSIGANETATVSSVKAARALLGLTERLKAGDQLEGREFETFLKGLGFSNSQAERAVRLHLQGQGDPAKAAPTAEDLLKALSQ
uniref:HK97 family phage prohead protease n=1 Tax=Yoonia sp. TaxID=2212373 RepID=UPI0040485D64